MHDRAGKHHQVPDGMGVFFAFPNVKENAESVKQAAKPSGSRYYECFYAAAAFVKVNINYTSKNFAVTCIYYLFIVQITYTHG